VEEQLAGAHEPSLEPIEITVGELQPNPLRAEASVDLRVRRGSDQRRGAGVVRVALQVGVKLVHPARERHGLRGGRAEPRLDHEVVVRHLAGVVVAHLDAVEGAHRRGVLGVHRAHQIEREPIADGEIERPERRGTAEQRTAGYRTRGPPRRGAPDGPPLTTATGGARS
jgi:hypothetical protein